MRKTFIVLSMLLAFVSCKEKDVMQVLNESYAKCQSIQNGEYRMEYSLKPMSDTVPIVSYISTYFSKIEDDTIFSMKFNLKGFRNDTLYYMNIYNGDSLFKYNFYDTTCVRYSVKVWPEEMRSLKTYSHFFDPVVEQSENPLSRIISDSLIIKEKLADTIIDGKVCYHILADKIKTSAKTHGPITVQTAVEHWFISKKDMLPIQYYEWLKLDYYGEVVTQIIRTCLKDYNFNIDIDENQFFAQPEFGFFKMEDYHPRVEIPLLEVGISAPEWVFPDLDGNDVRLADFQGRVVLLDFFYKSCGPCMRAVPCLQKLYEKYADDGFVVIGINPFDKPDEIRKLMQKKGLTYPIVCCNRDLCNLYHITGYPTIYILDRNGKVAFAESGYYEGMEEGLDEILRGILEGTY